MEGTRANGREAQRVGDAGPWPQGLALRQRVTSETVGKWRARYVAQYNAMLNAMESAIVDRAYVPGR